jgi:IMP dehydrogenase/GMP reductase
MCDNTTFDYKDINLIPILCIVDSREECDTSINLCGYKFNLPVVPANMECVIDQDLAIKLAQNNYFYIMHRFHIDIIDFIRTMHSLKLYASISIGVNKDSYDLLNKLKELNLIPQFITIDIAHDHSIKMKGMITFIKNSNEFNKTKIIAGNISTREAVKDLSTWGADIIKAGIGPGCLRHDTPILMAHGGHKNICDIKVGDLVKNMFGQNVRVLNVMHQGRRQVLKVKFSNSKQYIYVTPDHRFSIEDNYKVGNYNNNKYAWEEIDNLNIGDIVLGNNTRRYELLEKSYYGVVDTYDIEVDCDTHSFIANGMIVHNSACTTYPNTGFGSRDIQAYCVKECCEEAREYGIPIIADGGITQICDIAKSLVMGAKLVMIGGMFTGFEESPGKIVNGQDGKSISRIFWECIRTFKDKYRK